KPLVERRIRVVEGGVEVFEPVEQVARLLPPPPRRVLLRRLVQRHVADERVLTKLLRGLELLLLEELLKLVFEGLGLGRHMSRLSLRGRPGTAEAQLTGAPRPQHGTAST